MWSASFRGKNYDMMHVSYTTSICFCFERCTILTLTARTRAHFSLHTLLPWGNGTGAQSSSCSPLGPRSSTGCSQPHVCPFRAWCPEGGEACSILMSSAFPLTKRPISATRVLVSLPGVLRVSRLPYLCAASWVSHGRLLRLDIYIYIRISVSTQIRADRAPPSTC